MRQAGSELGCGVWGVGKFPAIFPIAFGSRKALRLSGFRVFKMTIPCLSQNLNTLD